jgi:NTP pyrophosphatase (non-canonical NTP hydrolase)
MNLSKLQLQKKKFDEERSWDAFPASQVFVHLVEEIGEIGRGILYSEGYKKGGLGHSEAPSEVQREYAQSFSLLLQLANMQGIDLEEAYRNEMRVMRRRFPSKAWRDYVKTLKL